MEPHLDPTDSRRSALPLELHLHEWLESPITVVRALGTADLSLLCQLQADARVGTAIATTDIAWTRRYADALSGWALAARDEFGDDEVDKAWPADSAKWCNGRHY